MIAILAVSSAQSRLQPTPDLSPRAVVQTQLSALEHNDSPKPNTGIAVAFRFASPANQRATGPLTKFIGIVRGEAYSPMINHRRAEVGQPMVKGREATVPVLVDSADGKLVAYLFRLRRQESEPYRNCWMTDGVELIGIKEPPQDGEIEL
ncbi:MAG: DUF4864 domain-containing protein [Myxococcota bacterium]